jgi:OB-fold nucleic acid binding domain
MNSVEPTAVLISALRPGQQVEGVFACSRKDRLFTRSGSPYLALELRDRSGTIIARAFQDADALAGRFERGELVRVSGRVERFRDQPVLEVVDIARLQPGADGPGSDEDPARFLPTAYRDLDELDGFLEHLAGEATIALLRPCWRGCCRTVGCVRICVALRARGRGTTPISADCSSTRSRWRRSPTRSASFIPA